ncbi:MAG: hypothetical protein AB7D46_06620 [Flavobacteriaceae bacterium]
MKCNNKIYLKNNLLIITSEFPPLPGGIGNHALHLALQFQKNEYEVTVVTDQRNKNLCADIDFDTKLDMKVVRIKRKNPAVLTYINRIQKTFSLIRKNQIIIAPSIIPYQFKRNRVLKLLSIFLLPVLLPLLVYQVYKSWKLANEKIMQGSLIEFLK